MNNSTNKKNRQSQQQDGRETLAMIFKSQSHVNFTRWLTAGLRFASVVLLVAFLIMSSSTTSGSYLNTVNDCTPSDDGHCTVAMNRAKYTFPILFGITAGLYGLSIAFTMVWGMSGHPDTASFTFKCEMWSIVFSTVMAIVSTVVYFSYPFGAMSHAGTVRWMADNDDYIKTASGLMWTFVGTAGLSTLIEIFAGAYWLLPTSDSARKTA